MRIGMIAMSGIRAASEEMTKVGMTMPAVVERGRIIAAMPSLSLLTLAALTPEDVEIEYHEIQDLRLTPELPNGFDLVAIATFSAQVFDAYAVARHYRERGVPVVMGGLHVTAMPDEAAQHCTAIVVGEGEPAWPQIIEDFRSGRLQPRYDQTTNGRRYNLGDAPLPRYDLLDVSRYNRLTVQTQRGCPHRCDFCASSILLTPGYAVKPVEKIIEEIRHIKRFWKRPFIEFADDNSFINRAHAKELMRRLRAERVQWFTETDVSIADDPELLRQMRGAGCRQVLIGLESPTSESLRGVELRRDWKLLRHPDYARAIETIQSAGITVNGCFILGLDGDTQETFDAIYQFVQQTRLFEAQLSVLTPFPGTPLYERLLCEGRILQPGAWQMCTLFDVNFVPRSMTPVELQQGLIDLARRIYDPEFVAWRRQEFVQNRRVG